MFISCLRCLPITTSNFSALLLSEIKYQSVDSVKLFESVCLYNSMFQCFIETNESPRISAGFLFVCLY